MQISRKSFIKSAALITGGVLFGVHESLAKILQQADSGFKIMKDNFGI